jgi:uncharacterized protein (TIGR01777 family)
MTETNLTKTVVIAGASGMIGTALVSSLKESDWRVLRLVRRPPTSPEEIQWNPSSGQLNLASAGPIDLAINLSGESIFGLWTADKRKKIRSSRIDSTRALVSAFGTLSKPPSAFLCSSAIGIYGRLTARPCDEEAPAGNGFLADVCKDWEAEALKAEQHGVRPVCVRTGLVLAPQGGMLGAMAPAFRLGLGGPVGSGKQMMSWIDLEDMVGLYRHAIEQTAIKGALNASAPRPVTNRELTQTLAQVLNRPAIIPIPAAVLRLLPGQFADQTLLSSIEALPAKALSTGYLFKRPELRDSLKHNLKG